MLATKVPGFALCCQAPTNSKPSFWTPIEWLHTTNISSHATCQLWKSPAMRYVEGYGLVMIRAQGYKGPKSLGNTTVGLYVYVEDVDALSKQAVAAGAKELRPVIDQFYGDRSGTYQDPFGHVWTIATHKEDLSPDEIAKRAQALGH